MIRTIKPEPFAVGSIVVSKNNGTEVKVTDSFGRNQGDFAGVVVFSNHEYEKVGYSSNSWSKTAFPHKEIDATANPDTVAV